MQLRRDRGRNINGITGGTNSTVAEVVLNWNLFNGFADRSRERQFAEQLNVARDARDKTCRDTRQTTMIAYNDVVKLREQLDYLQLHESSLARALTAYRLQFQIGQRSLLDLLDTENERFRARRAVVNAQHELAIAYVRTQAGIGNLLRALEVSSRAATWTPTCARGASATTPRSSARRRRWPWSPSTRTRWCSARCSR
ncbi:TolC family protein [Ramlibacter terrae]|uniref:TolC family protein n=1 Tax=Ramlibacter terrae TaxID=2732511 RepID=A0ABX6P6L5_9BURK|nr:TolC family protein [Ramlibacter terrae]